MSAPAPTGRIPSTGSSTLVTTPQPPAGQVTFVRTRRPAATRLVREGFAVWAFLVPPLWLLAKRLWLPFLAVTALYVALGFLPPAAGALAGLALSLLLGFEGRALERRGLARRGFAEVGVVAGHDEDAALLRLLTARPELARGALA